MEGYRVRFKIAERRGGRTGQGERIPRTRNASDAAAASAGIGTSSPHRGDDSSTDR